MTHQPLAAGLPRKNSLWISFHLIYFYKEVTLSSVVLIEPRVLQAHADIVVGSPIIFLFGGKPFISKILSSHLSTHTDIGYKLFLKEENLKQQCKQYEMNDYED